MQLPGKALAIKENREFPYFAVSFEHGFLLLVSAMYGKLNKLAGFHLCNSPLNSLYFAVYERVLVTADTNTGLFYIVETNLGTKMQILARVMANLQIVDYILIASKTCYRLFAIIVTSGKYVAGCKFIRYCIIKGRSTAELKEYELRDYNTLYTKIYATLGENRDRIFYAMPQRRKDLHEIEIKRGVIQFNHFKFVRYVSSSRSITQK